MNQTQCYFFLDQCSSCYIVWNSKTETQKLFIGGRPIHTRDSEMMQVQIGLDVQT